MLFLLHTQKYLSCFLLLGLIFSCEESNLADEKKSKVSQKSIKKEIRGTVNSACDLISESELKKILSIPESAKSSIEDVVRTYPTCFYKWKSMEYTEEKIISGKSFKAKYPTEVTMVLIEKANEKMFVASSKVYKDGEQIDNLGEKAIWSNKMSQLTFLANSTMIHVFTKVGSDKMINQSKSISIAKKIIENL